LHIVSIYVFEPWHTIDSDVEVVFMSEVRYGVGVFKDYLEL
jgi:hypothetical protein